MTKYQRKTTTFFVVQGQVWGLFSWGDYGSIPRHPTRELAEAYVLQMQAEGANIEFRIKERRVAN